VLTDLVSDRVGEMGLAEAHAAVDEERNCSGPRAGSRRPLLAGVRETGWTLRSRKLANVYLGLSPGCVGPRATVGTPPRRGPGKSSPLVAHREVDQDLPRADHGKPRSVAQHFEVSLSVMQMSVSRFGASRRETCAGVIRERPQGADQLCESHPR